MPVRAGVESVLLKIYRKGQGTAARWVTAAGLGSFALFGCYKLSERLSDAREIAVGDWKIGLGFLISGFVGLLCLVAIAWAVNSRRAVDFLILTEAELKKVSWPTKEQLSRQTIVVLVVIFSLAGFILMADLCFGTVMRIVRR